jgi:hypothetical protein
MCSPGQILERWKGCCEPNPAKNRLQWQSTKSGGDIQATTKVVDSRSLKSSPPERTVEIPVFVCRNAGRRGQRDAMMTGIL